MQPRTGTKAQRRPPGATSPTATLLCPHGGLAVESSPVTKRVRLPAHLWAFFRRQWEREGGEVVLW